MDKIKSFLTAHKITVGLGFILLILAFAGYSFFKGMNVSGGVEVPEVDLPFDAEGPYAIIYPRKDGNALVLSITRTASYDAISYEIAYTSLPEDATLTTAGKKVSPAPQTPIKSGKTDEGDSIGGVVDRGVKGDIDTKDKKGEYEQEILFGTCSKNVCKYDKGVENGTLTLHIKKGNKAFRMTTQWHLQKPDMALGILTSGDGHLSYKLDGDRSVLVNLDYSIINDLTGLPKLPQGKEVLGKVYSLNLPITKVLPLGIVTFELADNPPADAKLTRYDSSKSKWVEIDAKLEGSKFVGKSDSGGIFAVLTPKK